MFHYINHTYAEFFCYQVRKVHFPSSVHILQLFRVRINLLISSLTPCSLLLHHTPIDINILPLSCTQNFVFRSYSKILIFKSLIIGAAIMVPTKPFLNQNCNKTPVLSRLWWYHFPDTQKEEAFSLLNQQKCSQKLDSIFSSFISIVEIADTTPNPRSSWLSRESATTNDSKIYVTVKFSFCRPDF